MTESMFVEMKKESVDVMMENTKSNLKVEKEDLPGFLQDQSMQVDQSEIVAGNRNLSIIQEIQSVIENSQYEQTQTENHNSKRVKCKKQMTEQMYKILRNVLGETELQKAEYEDNYAKLLPVYNKLRTLSRNNNFHTNKMFQILVKTANYKSIIVLIAETLDFLEQKGVRKIEIIPFWIEKYLFTII